VTYYWVLGIVLCSLVAVSNVYLARELVFGVRHRCGCLRARTALLLVAALASSLAGATVAGSLPVVAAAPIIWIGLVTVALVAIPLWFAGAPRVHGLSVRGLRLVLRFFVLPAGGAASRMFEKISGREAHALDESHSAELRILFSAEAATLLQGEPLASVVREFARTTAEDIMVPRSAMVTVRSSLRLAECVEVFAARKFSRMPVYESDPESIIGIVHVMDLLRESDLSKSVRQIVRPVLMVPKTKECDQLLREFQRSQGYLAVVLDEYGGVAGLVTLEDVLEELVGEMGYEPLALRRTVRKVLDGLFLVHAQVEVEKFEALVGVKIPRGDYETLAGYLLQEFGRIPEPGARLERDGVVFEVVEADQRKIKLVKIRIAGLCPADAVPTVVKPGVSSERRHRSLSGTAQDTQA
jgi:putative hemolysin